MEKNHKVPVVVAQVLPPDLLARIEGVNGSVDLLYAGELLRQEHVLVRDKGTEALAGEGASLKAELDSMLAQAEVVFIPPIGNPNLTARLNESAAPSLRWVQITNVGVDGLRRTGILDRPVVVTTGQGLRSRSIAEYVVWAMITLNRGLVQRLQDQKQKIWNSRARISPLLRGQTLGIVGLGSIGSATAELGKALGMRVIAMRRSTVRRAQNVDGVDEVFPRSELLDLLGQSDFVLLSAPLTPETRRFMGEKELRAMKPSACLINISRGDLVDQDVLIQALKDGWIGGAALDVTTPEPLPPESELWDCPQTIITPHFSATGGDTVESGVDLFCRNLRAYLAGGPLTNVYDQQRGY